MRYATFRDAIHGRLRRSPRGLTWKELRDDLGLPYDRPCPEWIKAMEREIGLKRESIAARGRALVWRIDRDQTR